MNNYLKLIPIIFLIQTNCAKKTNAPSHTPEKPAQLTLNAKSTTPETHTQEPEKSTPPVNPPVVVERQALTGKVSGVAISVFPPAIDPAPPTIAPVSPTMDSTPLKANTVLTPLVPRTNPIVTVLSADPNLSNYFNYYICPVTDQTLTCKYSKESPGRFVYSPFVIPPLPLGEWNVSVQSCAINSKNNSMQCGEWQVTPYTSSDENNSAEVINLMEQSYELQNKIVEACSNAKILIVSTIKDITTTDPSYSGLASLQETADSLNKDECALYFTSMSSTQLSEISFSKDSFMDPSGYAFFIFAGTALVALIATGVSVAAMKHNTHQPARIDEQINKAGPTEHTVNSQDSKAAKSAVADASLRTQTTSSSLSARSASATPTTSEPSPRSASSSDLNKPLLQQSTDSHSTSARSASYSARNARLKKFAKGGLGAFIAGSTVAAGIYFLGLTDSPSDTLVQTMNTKLKEYLAQIQGYMNQRLELSNTLVELEKTLPDSMKQQSYTSNQQGDSKFDKEFSLILMSDPQLPWAAFDAAMTDSQTEASGTRTNQLHILAINQVETLDPRFIKPEAAIINGDLTAFGHKWQWDAFKRFYEFDNPNAYKEHLTIPIYPGLGNHDYQNNLDDCSGNWSTLFDIDNFKNACALASMQYIKDFVKKNKSKIISYDADSLSYAWDMHGIRFIQMNNHPGYEAPQIGIKSSMGWLKSELEKAKASKINVVLNFHVPPAAKLPLSKMATQEAKDFLEITKDSPVIAIFVGHFHENIGQKKIDTMSLMPTLSRDPTQNSNESPLLPNEERINGIPIFFCGSAAYLQFLYTHFHKSFFEVKDIFTDHGVPSFTPDTTLRPISSNTLKYGGIYHYKFPL